MKTPKKANNKTTSAPAPAMTVTPPPIAVAAPARSAAPVRTATGTASKTTIEAKIDVGFGNQLYVRGHGAGLSWERGTPLACVDGKTWRLQVPATDKVTFKLLLNDAVWSQGEDLTAAPGSRVEVKPTF
jgi:hypothetical protein